MQVEITMECLESGDGYVGEYLATVHFKPNWFEKYFLGQKVRTEKYYRKSAISWRNIETGSVASPYSLNSILEDRAQRMEIRIKLNLQ